MVIQAASRWYADISSWQPDFDAKAYAAGGYTRISLRATYGVGGTDTAFSSHWPASAVIPVRQAYCFAYPGDGVAMAVHFMSVVNAAGGFRPGDEAMLDLETLGVTPQQAAQITPAWVNTVRAASPNVRIFVYGNAWFIEAAGLTQKNLPNVGLIVASYGSGYGTPPGWDHTCIWQFTDKQTVPGLPNPVDCNTLVCPSNLTHLTTAGDEFVMDDEAKARFDKLDQTLAFMFTSEGARFDQTNAAIVKMFNLCINIYGKQQDGKPVDPTHTGVGDVAAKVDAVAAVVNEMAGVLKTLGESGGGTVDLAPVLAAVAEVDSTVKNLTMKAVS